MHIVSTKKRQAALSLFDSGLSDYEIARLSGASRSSVQRWRVHGAPRIRPTSLRWQPSDPDAYAYLLGIYLGDGYISKASQTPVLEISLDARYPGVVEECEAAVLRTADVVARRHLRPGATGGSIRLTAGSPIWSLAFPQHGAGKKTHSSAKNISVVERESVNRLDSFVGPKADAGGGI